MIGDPSIHFCICCSCCIFLSIPLPTKYQYRPLKEHCHVEYVHDTSHSECLLSERVGGPCAWLSIDQHISEMGPPTCFLQLLYQGSLQKITRLENKTSDALHAMHRGLQRDWRRLSRLLYTKKKKNGVGNPLGRVIPPSVSLILSSSSASG
jgi:hypothetical protein